MYQAQLNLDGSFGTVILILYIVGGILLMATASLPGNSTGWRVFGSILGIGLAAWAAYALLFGGWIIVSFFVVALPFILAVKGFTAMLQRGKATDASMQQPGQPGAEASAAAGLAPATFGAQPGQRGYQPADAPRGYPPPGPPQGYPGHGGQPGYPPSAPSYPPPGPAYPPQGYPQQPQGYPQPGYAPQGGQQGYPPAGGPAQGYPPPHAQPGYPPAGPGSWPPQQSQGQPPR